MFFTCSPRPPTLSQRHMDLHVWSYPRPSYIFQVSSKSAEGFRSPRGQNLAFPITLASRFYNSLYYRTSHDKAAITICYATQRRTGRAVGKAETYRWFLKPTFYITQFKFLLVFPEKFYVYYILHWDLFCLRCWIKLNLKYIQDVLFSLLKFPLFAFEWS